MLQNVSFRLNAGSFHFLMGPSGSGKSSLLKAMYLELLPSTGSMQLFGQVYGADSARSQSRKRWLEQRAAYRRQLAVVFQDFQLIEHLSVRDNVLLPVIATRGPYPNLEADVTDLLTWLGLGDRAAALPSELSGGQQQRVALARAFIMRPKLLLADEPTGNLDDALGHRLLFLLEELNKLGTTVIVATHNSSLPKRFQYPIIGLSEGRAQLYAANAANAAAG